MGCITVTTLEDTVVDNQLSIEKGFEVIWQRVQAFKKRMIIIG